jgi:hydroxyquinol 1,2-dioxygenase
VAGDGCAVRRDAGAGGQYVLHHGDEPAPDADVRGAWYSRDHHFVIEPGEARLPKPPITGKAQGERPVRVVLERR